MATQYAFGRIVTDGLVLSLDAADRNSYPGSGTTWTDMSGNGNNGTLTNGPTFSNNSIVFDGVDDYVTIPNSSTVQVDSFTLEGWVYPLDDTNPPSGQGFHIMRKEGSFILTHHWNSSQRVGLWMQRSSTTSWEATFSSTPVPINTWSYIVATYDNLATRIYNNAVQVGTVSRPGTTKVSTNAILVNGQVSNSLPKNYNLAGVKIYNRALSASEVAQNYNAQKSRFGL